MPEKIQCSAEVKVSCSGKTSHDASTNCSIESNVPDEVTGDDKSTTAPGKGQVPEPEFAQKLLDRLYDCRKIEIEHLWQRSVFLGTFIVLAFSGYGMLVGKMLDKTCNNHTIFMEQAHLAGMVCGCILLFLGVLWVCMAKGSKRWQELYERKIVLLEDQIFEKGFDQFKYKCEFRQKPEHDEGNQKKDCNCIFNERKERKSCSGNPEAGEDLAQSRCFCSLGAGPYSPSKINILLGWFTCLAGTGIMVMHLVKLYSWNRVGAFLTCPWTIIIVTVIVCCLCVWRLRHELEK